MWRPTQYDVEGRRPRDPMDMAVVGVRQRGRVLVPGVLMFFDEAHEHVLECPDVAFRLAVGLWAVCRSVHIAQPEESAYALKEPGSEYQACKFWLEQSQNEPVIACVMSHVPMPAKNHDRRSHATTR